jgi:MFS family permease
MADDAKQAGVGRLRALAPLSDRTFRTIWSASLLSNFGHLLLGVAAAWQMTRLTTSPQMVAMVQTALMAPLMLIAVPAGAIADMFDRRKIALAGLGFSVVAAATLTLLSILGAATPHVLLLFCFLIGSGLALYAPSWQASISEQVPAHHLPAAVALGSVSYNLARSVGPAIGGVVVMTLGVTAAFATNALFYIPLFTAFFFWKRKHVAPRLPPERLGRAIISGIRYAIHAAPVRTAMIRVFLFGCTSSALMSLTPLVARDLLKGDAGVYGLLLGASGVGAVMGAMLIGEIRDRFSPERSIMLTMTVTACMFAIVGISRSLPLTAIAMMVVGGANMMTVSSFNVSVQLSVPRWVVARALSWFQSSLTGGLAIGPFLWGWLAYHHSVGSSLVISGGLMLVLPLLGLLMPVRAPELTNHDLVGFANKPQIDIGLTARSGPVVVEVEYDVAPQDARDFYNAMQALQRARKRNGAFGWSLSRDIGNAALWAERFEFPTWQDYMRHRSRFTQADRDLQLAVNSYNRLPLDSRVRRWLGRPLGSVRWRAETPDLATGVGLF